VNASTCAAEVPTPYPSGTLGGRLTYGTRPAVLVIDLINGFTDTSYPPATDLDDVVASTRSLVDRARQLGYPVIFTTIAFAPDALEGRVWLQKMPVLNCLVDGSRAVEVDDRLARRADEPLVVKRAASAFTGTGLAALLTSLRIDQLVLAGATTSGCVRATAIDACAAGYPAIVPDGCVGDRHRGAHVANLFDIDAKYADVVTVDETLALLDAMSAAAA